MNEAAARPDVVAMMQSGNRYVYGINNPIRYQEPTGHTAFVVVAAPAVVAVIAVGGGAYLVYEGGKWVWKKISKPQKRHVRSTDPVYQPSNAERADTSSGEKEKSGSKGGSNPDDKTIKPGDPKKNPNPTIIATIVEQIKKTMDKLEGKCDEYATRFIQKLDELGISFKIIRVEAATGGVYSDKHGMIGTHGYHYGVQIGNMVFDNLSLTGMKCEAWLIDLGVGTHPGMTAEYVTEIITH